MKDARRYEIGVGLLLVAAAALLSFMAIKIGAVKSLGEGVVPPSSDAGPLLMGAILMLGLVLLRLSRRRGPTLVRWSSPR